MSFRRSPIYDPLLSKLIINYIDPIYHTIIINVVPELKNICNFSWKYDEYEWKDEYSFITFGFGLGEHIKNNVSFVLFDIHILNIYYTIEIIDESNYDIIECMYEDMFLKILRKYFNNNVYIKI